MFLTEEYRKRILELSGVKLLNETDNRNVIINKIGMPAKIADWAHNLSNKYSIWIANSFKELILKTITKDKPELEPEIRKQFLGDNTPVALKKVISDRFFGTHNGDYQHILDWLQRRNQIAIETDQINFKTLTFEEALKRSEKWHEQVAAIQGGRIEDEDGEVIITFPDGFYWIDLKKGYCEKEAKAMGHCANAQGNLYSLRKEQYPYLTADISNGYLIQLRGRVNSKPKSDFHPYIIEFLLSPKTKIQRFQISSYRSNDNFLLSDLSEKDISKVINKKPGFIIDLEGNIFEKWEWSKILAFINEHPDVVSHININDSLLTSMYDNDVLFNNITNLIEKYPTMLDRIDFNELIDEVSRKYGDFSKVGDLLEMFPQIYDRTNLHLDTMLAFYLKGDSTKIKQRFIDELNKNSSLDKIVGDTVNIYVKDWSDLSVFFTTDQQKTIEEFWSGDHWDMGGGPHDWDDGWDSINKENLKTIIQILRKRGYKVRNAERAKEIIDENDESDIQDAIESGMYEGYETSSYNEHDRAIKKALRDQIGIYTDNPEWISFPIQSKDKPKEVKNVEMLKVTMSFSDFSDFVDAAMNTLIGDYDNFSIEDVITHGADEGNGRAEVNFDHLYGDFDDDSFNYRLADELPSVSK